MVWQLPGQRDDMGVRADHSVCVASHRPQPRRLEVHQLGQRFLQGNRADGSYVTLLRSSRDQWSTIIETTAGVTRPQQASFTVRGGDGLASKTVHVWSSNFNFTTGGPAQWFVRQPDITPVHGRFTLTIKPGYVYSLTTTSGQGRGTAAGPPAAALRLPYGNNLSAGNNGEPTMLAAEDGSFELAACHSPAGQHDLYQADSHRTAGAVGGWPGAASPLRDNRQQLDGLRCQRRRHAPAGRRVGLLSRYYAVSASEGTFNGYIFDVNTNGTFTLKLSKGGTAAYTQSGQQQNTPPRLTLLARGKVPFSPGVWHKLSLSISRTTITASVDGKRLASLTDSTTLKRGIPGIEVGGWYPAYFSNLNVTAP